MARAMALRRFPAADWWCNVGQNDQRLTPNDRGHPSTSTMDRTQRAVSGLHGLKWRHLAYATAAVSGIDGQLWLAGERGDAARNRVFCYRCCHITTRGVVA